MFAIFSHEELLTLIYYKMVSYKELGLVNTKEMFGWHSYERLSKLGELPAIWFQQKP